MTKTRPWWSFTAFETLMTAAAVIAVCWYIASWPHGIVEWIILPVAVFFGRSAAALAVWCGRKAGAKISRRNDDPPDR